jgi:hypothetical protein
MVLWRIWLCKTRVDSFEKEWETVSFNQVIKPKQKLDGKV